MNSPKAALAISLLQISNGRLTDQGHVYCASTDRSAVGITSCILADDLKNHCLPVKILVRRERTTRTPVFSDDYMLRD